MAGLVALRLVFGGVGPSTFSALIAEFHVDSWGFDDGIIPVLIPRDDDSALGIEGQFPRSPAISGFYNRDFGHDVI
jgi:hypothetical protein